MASYCGRLNTELSKGLLVTCLSRTYDFVFAEEPLNAVEGLNNWSHCRYSKVFPLSLGSSSQKALSPVQGEECLNNLTALLDRKETNYI